jgi:hypothetical protein
VGAAERLQVADLVDESPRLLRVGVTLGRTGVASQPADQVEVAEVRVHLVEERAGQQQLGQGLERERIVRRANHPERRGDVADHLVILERLALGEAAGHARLHEPALEQLADPVRPVQQRVLAPVESGRRAVGGQIGHQPARLLPLVLEAVRGHAMLRVAVGLELLFEERRVARDEPPRGLEDLAGAAPVPVQHHGVGDLEVGAEAIQNGGVGAGPGKDRLLVVAHGEAVAVIGRETGDHLVLRETQVLELVHQEAVPAGPDLGGRLGLAAEQLAGERDQIVVVQQVAGAERLAVVPKQLEVAGR